MAPEGGHGHSRGPRASAFLNRYRWLLNCALSSRAVGGGGGVERKEKDTEEARVWCEDPGHPPKPGCWPSGSWNPKERTSVL